MRDQAPTRETGLSEMTGLLEEHSPSRRHFLRAAVVGSAWRALGLTALPARWVSAGLLPAASLHAAQGANIAQLPPGLVGKEGLRVLNDRPENAETPAHLLDDDITPANRLFVRNNGVAPVNVDPASWRLAIGGEACANPQSFLISELKQRFSVHTFALQLECGGNGRSEFRPRASGNQWSTGAVGCPQWTGVRLADVLRHCGISPNAVYVGYKGADTHLSGDANKTPISRGVPMAKALENESLIAFAMNGAPIPAVHGAPLRLVCGGWPGSVSGKWLTELLVRDRIHDGAKMGGNSYRVPCNPVAPGTQVAERDMCIIESMPVKSLISFPESGVQLSANQPMGVRGHAWAGDDHVAGVDISTDFGASWSSAEVSPPVNRLAWQRWSSSVEFSRPGYYEIWARATDSRGIAQPMLVPGWNPKGYLNNACHRVAVRVV